MSAAERNGIILVAVTLNAPDDWNDHKKLLDYGFSQVENSIVEVVDVPQKIQVVGGKKNNVSVKLAEPFSVISSEKTGGISSCVLLDSFLYAPVRKGEKVGKVVYFLGDRKVGESIITAEESVPKATIEKKKDFFQKIIDFIKGIFK